MIDFTTIRRTIETELNDNFSTVPIMFENVGMPDQTDQDEFIAVEDQASFSEGTGLGDTVTHLGGVILIKIYTTRGEGTQRSRVIATELATLLADQQLTDISLQEASLHTAGDVDGSEYFLQVLQIPYSLLYGQNEASCFVSFVPK